MRQQGSPLDSPALSKALAKSSFALNKPLRTAPKAMTHAGQGGDVDDGSRFEALCIGQCVTQHQAAFGVGVEVFNGLAAHAGNHITRFHGFAAGHVFTGGDQADDIDFGLEV
ncbi:MAG: hypothetical protein RL171_1295 [Pseudomonadota bacterium]